MDMPRICCARRVLAVCNWASAWAIFDRQSLREKNLRNVGNVWHSRVAIGWACAARDIGAAS